MLLDMANFELLRLVTQYRDFPADCRFPGVYLLSQDNTDRLIKEGLLYTSRDGKYHRATRLGYDLLNFAGVRCGPDNSREAHKHVLSRRDASARAALTLLLAGANVYASDAAQLIEGAYLSAGNARRNQRAEGRNTMGSARFTGLMGGSGFVFYYVTDPNERLYCGYEKRTALGALARAPRQNDTKFSPAVVYMGKDYRKLCAAVTDGEVKKACYRSASGKFGMPVYLCPCDTDGAFQMRIILKSGYREKIISAIFGSDVTPPGGISCRGCDGFLKGNPVILGIDMDIRRLTGVVNYARENGGTARLYARACQNDALREVFSGASELYDISDTGIKNALSFSSQIIEPDRNEPYITKDGRRINDADIRICRAARKVNRKKGEASEKKS
jgi:hypothetical protein